MTTTDTPDWNMIAAEYVLRVLPAKEESAFEDRLAREPKLRQMVAHWVAQFEGLDQDFADITPRRGAKRALMQRLFDSSVAIATPIWQRLWLWQGASFAALALAGFFAVQTLSLPENQPATGAFLAEVAAEDDSLRVLAAYNPANGQLQLTRTAGAALDGRVLELWAIDGDNAPVSLGVLPDTQTAAVVLPEQLRDTTGLVLAISDEPLGGSPTGAPTGQVLAVGTTHGV